MDRATGWLRLGAALLIYDETMRRHICEQMQKAYWEDWEARLIAALPKSRREEWYGTVRQQGVAIEKFLEARDFAIIVRKHGERFTALSDRWPQMDEARDLRNRFAHPGAHEFTTESVEKGLKILSRLVHQIDGKAAAELAHRDSRVRELATDAVAPDGAILPAPEVGKALSREIRPLLRQVLDRITEALKPRLSELSARVDEIQRHETAELRAALSEARTNVEQSQVLLEAADRDRATAREDRQAAERLRKQTLAQPISADEPRPAPTDGRHTATPEAASADSGEEGVEDYRDRFRESGSGNGWIWASYVDGWRVARWVGNKQGGTSACAFAPSRWDREKSIGIDTGGGAILDEGFADEDAAFRRLFAADQSGEIERKARAAIAAWEEKDAAPEDPQPDERVPF